MYFADPNCIFKNKYEWYLACKWQSEQLTQLLGVHGLGLAAPSDYRIFNESNITTRSYAVTANGKNIVDENDDLLLIEGQFTENPRLTGSVLFPIKKRALVAFGSLKEMFESQGKAFEPFVEECAKNDYLNACYTGTTFFSIFLGKLVKDGYENLTEWFSGPLEKQLCFSDTLMDKPNESYKAFQNDYYNIEGLDETRVEYLRQSIQEETRGFNLLKSGFQDFYNASQTHVLRSQIDVLVASINSYRLEGVQGLQEDYKYKLHFQTINSSAIVDNMWSNESYSLNNFEYRPFISISRTIASELNSLMYHFTATFALAPLSNIPKDLLLILQHVYHFNMKINWLDLVSSNYIQEHANPEELTVHAKTGPQNANFNIDPLGFSTYYKQDNNLRNALGSTYKTGHFFIEASTSKGIPELNGPFSSNITYFLLDDSKDASNQFNQGDIDVVIDRVVKASLTTDFNGESQKYSTIITNVFNEPSINAYVNGLPVDDSNQRSVLQLYPWFHILFKIIDVLVNYKYYKYGLGTFDINAWIASIKNFNINYTTFLQYYTLTETLRKFKEFEFQTGFKHTLNHSLTQTMYNTQKYMLNFLPNDDLDTFLSYELENYFNSKILFSNRDNMYDQSEWISLFFDDKNRGIQGAMVASNIMGLFQYDNTAANTDFEVNKFMSEYFKTKMNVSDDYASIFVSLWPTLFDDYAFKNPTTYLTFFNKIQFGPTIRNGSLYGGKKGHKTVWRNTAARGVLSKQKREAKEQSRPRSKPQSRPQSKPRSKPQSKPRSRPRSKPRRLIKLQK